jgi:mannose-6-phosphate isomerase-like protein (cupin superfamily)
MIVRTQDDLKKLDSVVSDRMWTSYRYLLKKDGVGFSLHETVVEAGSEQVLWYKNHIEANLILEGEAEVEDLGTGRKYALKPGSMYVLDGHERHIFRSKTRVRLVCVFNPPCTGKEVHDADGSFPLL